MIKKVLKPVFTIIDKKVTFQSEREKVKSSIVEILNAPKSLVSIDINDARDLFQEGGEIHTYDASVGASMKKRMELLMDLIIENTKKYEPFSHALIFFFFPEDRPLLMEELKPFSDWIESVPGELRIKWGMATQSTQELRAIILLQ
jgi:hypothetical protein